MKTTVTLSLLFGLSIAWASQSPKELAAIQDVQDKENKMPAFSKGVDNPAASESPFMDVLERKYFRPFSTVVRNLHESVEQETDIVYFVNTGEARNHCTNAAALSIPHQSLVVLKRTSRDVPMFHRDSSGRVIGINPQGAQFATLALNGRSVDSSQSPEFRYINEITGNETPFVPVSTGTVGGSKILTYSGIFRINEKRTNAMRKSTNTVRDPMQWSVYINGEYNDGGEARLALHGTSQNYWHLLGVQRASSGCIRLQSDFSQWNQSLLFSKAANGELVPRKEFSGDVHVWNRRDHFPPAEAYFQHLDTGYKLRVLVIFFDGYDSTCS